MLTGLNIQRKVLENGCLARKRERKVLDLDTWRTNWRAIFLP